MHMKFKTCSNLVMTERYGFSVIATKEQTQQNSRLINQLRTRQCLCQIFQVASVSVRAGSPSSILHNVLISIIVNDVLMSLQCKNQSETLWPQMWQQFVVIQGFHPLQLLWVFCIVSPIYLSLLVLILSHDLT